MLNWFSTVFVDRNIRTNGESSHEKTYPKQLRIKKELKQNQIEQSINDSAKISNNKNK